LTKRFEEFLRGLPAELLAEARRRNLKGEFVVLIAPQEEPPPGAARPGTPAEADSTGDGSPAVNSPGGGR
jgi:16S rRNA C1402 (ribose-2'-O) methylase RsmI